MIELFNTHVEYKLLFRWLKEKGILKIFFIRVNRLTTNIGRSKECFFRTLALFYKYPTLVLMSRLVNERIFHDNFDKLMWQSFFKEYNDFHTIWAKNTLPFRGN